MDRDSEMKNIHILTLNWNGGIMLTDLISSVTNEQLDKDINYTWHIRDNGSTDDSIERIEKWNDPRIKVYPIGHNRDSFSKGVNYLFEKANPGQDDLILLLNNDIVFNYNFARSLQNIIYQMKDGVGVVGTKLEYMGGGLLQHAGVIFGQMYGLNPYHYRHKEIADEYSSKNRYFQAVTAACCLVRASSFKRIGGMDEKYRWAFDDVDMCLSIGRDEKIVYCGNTKAYHGESVSLKKNPVNKMFMSSNVAHFKSKWAGKYIIDHDFYLKDPNYNVIE